jgi:predicted RNA-binding Zn-ribbon protein involved in translation (DUF1610 family)
LSEQKYRQHGYGDRDRSERKREHSHDAADKPIKKETFGPRALQMPGTRNISRCTQCGTVLTGAVETIVQCPKCGFDLHSCKQCSFFDPSSRFECTQPIAERVPKKDQRNQCTFYSIIVRVEKETSSPAPVRANDARQAFENLFKK